MNLQRQAVKQHCSSKIFRRPRPTTSSTRASTSTSHKRTTLRRVSTWRAEKTAGAYTGTDASPAFARTEKRTQIQDNVSVIAGSHLFKAGGDIQFVRSTFNDLFATGGQYTFDTVGDFLTNTPSRFIQRFNTESR